MWKGIHTQKAGLSANKRNPNDNPTFDISSAKSQKILNYQCHCDELAKQVKRTEEHIVSCTFAW